jgi:hypothetical protein|eukprot:COSAG01_NODE_185_length_22691_cov_53.142478_27_plen_171_part_00
MNFRCRLCATGGDPIKLVSANLNISNNTIHAFARVSRTIRPGVAWGGCGITVCGNEIYDAPHSGIMIAPSSDGRSTNCIFEDNHLHDLCKGTADAGGLYAGRTWANRGNVVRRNTFRRFFQTEKMSQATSVNGICESTLRSFASLLLPFPTPVLTLSIHSLLGAIECCRS